MQKPFCDRVNPNDSTPHFRRLGVLSHKSYFGELVDHKLTHIRRKLGPSYVQNPFALANRGKFLFLKNIKTTFSCTD